MKHTIFITGAAGYVGSMLVREFAARDDVVSIIGLDKEAVPELIAKEKKLTYIQKNTAESWEDEVRVHAPTIVVHTAWQIREMYGKQKLQWQWNVVGSDKVFAFVANEPSVTKLVHFSTVASYGAFPSNTLEHRFTEEEPFRKTDYLYAEEKRIVEERLRRVYEEATKKGKKLEVAVIRPAAITGPRGRFMRIRFGLQAALSGQLKETFIHKLISLMVSFVPAPPLWCRQFVHEDDIVDIVSLFAFSALKEPYEVVNACPPGALVLAKDMAKAVGKKTLSVPPFLIRIVFFFMWHGTRGRVPTSRGGWKSYSYPIAVSGVKLTREYGYQYRMSSLEAFQYTNGRYESFVPKELQNHKA